MVIDFATKFYPFDSIQETIAAFADIVEAELVGSQVRLELKGEGDLEEVGLEFCNYAFGTVANEYVL
ncbi:hypothetical protein H6504_01130 [Candidatus Woesearchaeota archaeon]|nr:hypothetical protein [Candidatus Woesearchaeota archaeon]